MKTFDSLCQQPLSSSYYSSTGFIRQPSCQSIKSGTGSKKNATRTLASSRNIDLDF